MGISNISNGWRPGICTSTTRPTAPYEGQMIYETDTNRLVIYDGSAWVYIADTDTPPGLEFIKKETLTSGSTKEITSVFSSTFTNYRVVISELQTSTQANIYFRFGTTTSAYYGTYYYDKFDAASTGTVRKNNGGELQISIADNYSGDSVVSFDVGGPNTTASRKNITGTSYGSGWTGWFGGAVVSSTQFTSFTIGTASGTFSAGNVFVYGYRG